MNFKEWPNIEFPEFLERLGFVDESWHNDMCAKAVKVFPRGPDEDKFSRVECWVEAEALEDREDWKNDRFSVFPIFNGDDHTRASEAIYQGEYAQECERAISRWLTQREEMSDWLVKYFSENSRKVAHGFWADRLLWNDEVRDFVEMFVQAFMMADPDSGAPTNLMNSFAWTMFMAGRESAGTFPDPEE